MSDVPNMLQDVVDFHEKFKLQYTGKPRLLEGELFDFRAKFAEEEHRELVVEQGRGLAYLEQNLPNGVQHVLEQQLDAHLDAVYVQLGTAYMQFGAEVVAEGWRRVQTANMAKVRATKAAQSKRGTTYDVIKPEGWQAPDHSDLVQEHAHR